MNSSHRLPFLAVIFLVVLGAASAFADIEMLPNLLDLDEGVPSGEVVVSYVNGSEGLRGYSIDVVWDPALATAVFSRPDIGLFNTNATFGTTDIAPGHVQVDAVIGGAHPTILSGELFKVAFTAVPNALGDWPITLTIVSFRGDPPGTDIDGGTVTGGHLDVDMDAPTVTNIQIENNTLAHTDDFVKNTDDITITATVVDSDPLFTGSNIKADLSGLVPDATEVTPNSYGPPLATWSIPSAVCFPTDGSIIISITAIDGDLNEASGSISITADNTAPTALENAQVTPGHKQLHLSWDDIDERDANALGVEFCYVAWGDYPEYDTDTPDYPANHSEGDEALSDTTGTSADWAVLDRDIYYVAGFVYDRALNYGPTGTTNFGRATNYWLGDVDGPGEDPPIPPEGFPDGIVDVTHDITRLGNTYGLPDDDEDFDMYCNVGPTDTFSPRGIPNPNGDDKIGFEDMMIFALNWEVVTPTTKNSIGGTPVLAWRQVDETTWALSLEENGGDLQGLNLRADLPAGIDCSVTRGDLLGEQPEPVFLRNIPGRGIDAGLAIFGQGAGISGAGELVRVTLSKPVADLDVVVTARDAENKDLSVELGSGNGSAIPTMARFAQNYPNPFNPRTTLLFELPQDRQVHLAVYAVDGTRVRTLVDGLRTAGRHEISWDGRDDSGRSVAAGTYFARIGAGDMNRIIKMVLVK